MSICECIYMYADTIVCMCIFVYDLLVKIYHSKDFKMHQKSNAIITGHQDNPCVNYM